MSLHDAASIGRRGGRKFVQITAEDIKLARKILRRWKQRAEGSGKQSAVHDVEHIMRVIDALTGK